MSDRYGQILIQVTENNWGYVLLAPVSERRAKEVGKSNWHDGSSSVCLRDSQDIEQFMADFPKSTYKGYNGKRRINSGVRILIDSWVYRHMVGGQSD